MEPAPRYRVEETRRPASDGEDRLGKGGKHRPPLAASTLQRIRVTLRVALNAAVRDGLIEHNPARHLELPRPRKARAVIWTEDQVEQWKRTGKHPSVAVWTAAQTAQLLHAAREHRLYAAFHLVALRGLRRAETAGCAGAISTSRTVS